VGASQSGKRYRHQSAHGIFRGKAARRSEREQAVARQLVRRYIGPDVAGRFAFGYQIPDETVEVLLCSGDMFIPMQQRSNCCGVALVLNEPISSENCLEAFEGTAGSITKRFQLP